MAKRWTLRRLKPRLNKGYRNANLEPSKPKRDYKIYLPEATVGLEELAEMFFTHAQKIRIHFYKTGIIKPIGKESGRKIFFDRQKTINILSQYVNGHGQLQLFKVKK